MAAFLKTPTIFFSSAFAMAQIPYQRDARGDNRNCCVDYI
jgi:hypothetical protein